ncbi:MAG: dethiobiotin synthase [Candidatus Berkiellales bacterium]
MTGVFITSTGTGIGKTFITTSLLRCDQTQKNFLSASKPIISGWPKATQENQQHEIQYTDTGLILKAQGKAVTKEFIEAISPWRFDAPLAPDMAAKRQNKEIHPESLISHSKMQIEQAQKEQKVHLIEGVGGVMVPINQTFTVLDWCQALNCPCILVVGSYLGTLSHTLTAISVLQMRGIKILALVVNETPQSSGSLHETSQCLMTLLPEINVFTLNYDHSCNEQTILPLYHYLYSNFQKQKI